MLANPSVLLHVSALLRSGICGPAEAGGMGCVLCAAVLCLEALSKALLLVKTVTKIDPHHSIIVSQLPDQFEVELFAYAGIFSKFCL